MRGEFRRANGEVIPNSVTDSGRKEYLRMICRGIDGTQIIDPATTFHVGLSNNVPLDTLALSVLVEPTIGVNGYARQAIARLSTGWPNEGVSNGEPFIETADIVFVAAGGDFDSPISRLFLTPEPSALVGELWALSAALATPITITPSTPAIDRTFRYRLYMR